MARTPPPHQLSWKLLRILDRLGCFSFLSALASIWRMRSRVKAHQINLQRSLIGSEYQPIRGSGQPFWVCGRDTGEVVTFKRKLMHGRVRMIPKPSRYS
jgi:hypothetical protein